MILARLAIAPFAAAIMLLASPTAKAPTPSMNVLIVGGGPDKEYNQVGIESNVRYVHSLLPVTSTVHVLYANGDPGSRIVQYEDDNGDTHYRPTILRNIDGP